MPDDQADDEDDGLLDRWGDLEQPFGDPEESRLSLETSSTVDTYGEPDAEELTRDLSDVDPDLLNTFAVCAVLANLGVLLVSVGILLAVFRGRLRIGGGLVVIGFLTLLRVRQYYRSYKSDREADSDADSDADEHADTDRPADSEGEEPSADGGSTDTDSGATDINDSNDDSGHNP